jgi:hypothetical protein
MKQTANDWMLFKFHLSAFLSAARSITLVMQKEYAHAAGFESWYERQQEEMRKDGLLTFFNNLRVTSIYIKTSPTQSPIFTSCGRFIFYAQWFYNCDG